MATRRALDVLPLHGELPPEDQDRALQLVYNSLRADPQPVLTSRLTIPVRAAVPTQVSAQLSLAVAPVYCSRRRSNGEPRPPKS